MPDFSKLIHFSLAVKVALPTSGASFRAAEATAAVYKEAVLDGGHRLDVPVSNPVMVEIREIEALLPIRDTQLLTCLKLDGLNLGLLINFNVPVLKEGIRRIVPGLKGIMFSPSHSAPIRWTCIPNQPA